MNSATRPLWEKEESVEAASEASFAFRYWTTAANMMEDPSIERVETDGPYLDRPGIRGKTHLAGGGSSSWVVAAVDPDRRLVIDMTLPDATLRFELKFEDREGGGSILSQRVSLFGSKSTTFLEQVEESFGTSLREGMKRVRDRIDAARLAEGGNP